MATKHRLSQKTIDKIAEVSPAKPAKTSAASKKLADKVFGEAKKPTKAPKVNPAKLDPALSAARGVPTETPKAKRTVSLAGTARLSDVPDHEVYGVEELRAKLAEFPRGATFVVSMTAPFINVYNLRGRLIGRIKDGPKQKKKKAKTARADKL